MRIIFLWIGFFICFPSFSILNISESTGIQMLLPLTLGLLILEILYFIKYGLNKKFAFEAIMFFLTWSFSIIMSVVGSFDAILNTLSISSILVKIIHLQYLIGVFILFAGPIGNVFNMELLNGYKYGAVISSFYAIYQVVASKLGWMGVAFLNNNPSFPSVVAYAEEGVLGRGFGFTPEPSILIVVLLPIFLISLFELVNGKFSRKNLIQTLIIFVGLLSTLSIGIILSLPLSLLIIFTLKREKKIGILLHKTTFKWLLATLGIIFPIFFIFNSENLLFVERASNLLTDGSVLMRFYSMVAAIDIFLESPIYGHGVSITSDMFLNHTFIYNIEDKAGVDSIPVLLMMQHGIIGITVYLTVVVLAIKNAKNNLPLLAGVIGAVVVTALQCGYIAIYHLWILLGLGYSNKYKKEPSI